MIKLIRQNRRSMVITVGENNDVIIKAPFYLSDEKIKKFVYEKANWIKKQRSKNIEKNEIINRYDFENYVYINNEKLDWSEIQNNDKRMTKSSFYTKEFYKMLENRAEKWQKLFKKTTNFKLCNSQCIWGSCNSKGIIKLNWKMILLPEEMQDYIIIHELCHTIQLNHSIKFWSEVESRLSNYKEIKKGLEKYTFILKNNVF